MRQHTKGKCKYCGKEYTFSYMKKHLSICDARQKKMAEEKGGKECGYFELAVSGKYNKNYWLFIEVKETATLEDIDQFLRDIWLECCGHLSAFDIDGISYEIAPENDLYWGRAAKSMKCKLGTVLRKGLSFGYEYDFGSTTELLITVVNYRIGVVRKEKLRILSRNNPIEILCDECGEKPAAYICPECLYEGDGFLCEDCAKTHECGEDMLLDVCNSPRMGVCGYCGSDRYPDQFVPDI
ncbi:MAG: hypothetical protein NC489_25100 [Ruminococcus flavefaciens]|nr:hypothetical protein [Ruminococcus flavefaciens]